MNEIKCYFAFTEGTAVPSRKSTNWISKSRDLGSYIRGLGDGTLSFQLLRQASHYTI